MKAIPLLLVLVVLAGCGGDDDETETAVATAQPTATATAEQADDQPAMKKPAKRKAAKKKRAGTRVILAESQFGTMLFNAKKQAIYIFENDPKGKSTCYDDCATAWPPVYTSGEPVAGDGIKAKLLGTTKRRDGKRQVTYGGKPLYYYVNEGPGEVRCHNVHLNGGLWWVVGPDGKRRP